MLAVGIYHYRTTKSAEDYLLGGRRLPPFVTALSAQASDMSGWLLLGLPGAIYLGGLGQLWMVAGLLVGTWLNWLFVAPRLRKVSAEVRALTLPAFFQARLGGGRALGAACAVVTFFFFSVYAASGLVASGLLFEFALGVPYEVAVWIGALVILLYTALGGFLAVSWTDVAQGLLMLFALLILPVLGLVALGDGEMLSGAGAAGRVELPLSRASGGGFLAAFSAASWGLGYFGQPHILVRFMAVRDVGAINAARRIALVWVILCFAGAVLVGWTGTMIYPEGLEKAERVFIHLAKDLADPWTRGVLLAAILAAIMSTIDSQLLVSASALSEDLYTRFLRTNSSERERVFVGRVAVIGITAIATALALGTQSTVLGLVKYAWGGLGAAFGPLLLFGLAGRRPRRGVALGALCGATVVTVVWHAVGFGEHLYEIVPGFATGALILWLGSDVGSRFGH